MAIESGILLKNHVSCNFVLKYHMKISLWHFTKTLNQFFYLSRKDENLEICIVIWFAQSNESKQFWGTFIGKHFNKWYNLIFIWLSPAVKQLLVKLNFEFPHAINFFCTWNKEAVSCRPNIVTFRHNFAYIVNSFSVSFDITVMINILIDIIKLLHEKMIRAINLYWFRNDVPEKNNSLNGLSNEP